MKISFSSNAYTNYNVFDAIRSVSKIGYSGIELLIDTPHLFLPIKKNSIKLLKKELKTNNILVSNLNVNTVEGWNEKTPNKFEPSLSNSDPKLRRWRINYTKNAINLAEQLESKTICITSGTKNSKTIKSEKQIFKKSLNELSEYAEKNNVSIAIEYEPGLLIEDSDSVMELCKDFKNLGLNLDTCHAMVIGENIEKIIKKFNKKIFHFHLSDCKDGIHHHLIPGKGSIDFQKIFKILKNNNYRDFLSVELYPYSENPEDAAINTFNYLQKFLK